jgi:hypothetical protein
MLFLVSHPGVPGFDRVEAESEAEAIEQFRERHGRINSVHRYKVETVTTSTTETVTYEEDVPPVAVELPPVEPIEEAPVEEPVTEDVPEDAEEAAPVDVPVEEPITADEAEALAVEVETEVAAEDAEAVVDAIDGPQGEAPDPVDDPVIEEVPVADTEVDLPTEDVPVDEEVEPLAEDDAAGDDLIDEPDVEFEDLEEPEEEEVEFPTDAAAEVVADPQRTPAEEPSAEEVAPVDEAVPAEAPAVEEPATPAEPTLKERLSALDRDALKVLGEAAEADGRLTQFDGRWGTARMISVLEAAGIEPAA